MAVEHRGDPVVARQHFARDLRVARLVGADQADQLNSGDEEESAEGEEGDAGQSSGGRGLADVYSGFKW